METNLSLKKSSPLYDRGQTLILAAQEYFDEYKASGGYGAVVWLRADNGSFIAFTRGEYFDEFMTFVRSINGGEAPLDNPFVDGDKEDEDDE